VPPPRSSPAERFNTKSSNSTRSEFGLDFPAESATGAVKAILIPTKSSIAPLAFSQANQIQRLLGSSTAVNEGFTTEDKVQPENSLEERVIDDQKNPRRCR